MLRHLKGRRLALWLMPALLLGVLGLAACGSTITSTQTSTPTANQIIQNATHASIKDMAFTLSMDTSTAGQSVSITGSGKVTKDPSRLEMDMTVPFSGQSLSMTLIADGGTKSVYVKFDGSNSLGIPTGKWYDASSGTLSSLGSLSDVISTFTDFSGLKNPTLVSGDTINGVAVWHIRATEAATPTPGAATPASESGTVDAYFRKDNYYPVKLTGTGSGAAALNVTVNYTSVNSGITITLPPASEVQKLG